MIYLLLDCYKDSKGEYHDILKIGYSKDKFSENREKQYNTHNYGYKLLEEREGSTELENYLHKKFEKYKLDREWFTYNQEIIDTFHKIPEDDINTFDSQKELNEYIRESILIELVKPTSYYKSLYLQKILDELKEQDPEYSDNKEIYRSNILDTFEFISSHEYDYFKNLDFDSLEVIEDLKKCNLYLPQIVGRQRNKDNPFKNDITVFYRTKRKDETSLTEENFRFLQNERKQSTQNLLEIYDKVTSEEQKDYIRKLESDVKQSKYANDFVSISKNTNKPVWNTFVEISHERAWEVSQKDYQDSITVTKALESISSGDISVYRDDLEIEVDNFLSREFYSTGIFKIKMRKYCAFMDKHKGNERVSELLYYKIKDPKYRKYYNFYGTKGCSAKRYEEKLLEEGMYNVSRESELCTVVRNKFRTNERYTLKDIKSILQDIYRDLGITSKAKATDLEKFYDLTRVRIKQKEGYILSEKSIPDYFQSIYDLTITEDNELI